MPFPTTVEELEAQGYKFDRHGQCSSKHCLAQIVWYWTPKGKKIPLDFPTLVPHFSTCPDVKRFKRSSS